MSHWGGMGVSGAKFAAESAKKSADSSPLCYNSSPSARFRLS